MATRQSFDHVIWPNIQDDMPILNQGYHCNSFWAFEQNTRTQWDQKKVGIVWPYKQQYKFKHHVWVQNRWHTSLLSSIITKRTLFLHKQMPFFSYLISANSLTLLHLPLMFVLLPCSHHSLKRVLSFKSLPIVIYINFPLVIFNMPFTKCFFKRQPL